MNRIIDETILGVFCTLLVFLAYPAGASVVATLCAIILVCVCELASPRVAKRAILCAYVAAALFLPSFALYLPVVAYEMFADEHPVIRFAWVVPLIVHVHFADYAMLIACAALCAAACVMSWRTALVVAERRENMRRRDELRESSLELVRKNGDLLERQDYEVRLATMSERARIAREIHDNVGHLLTRSVLQVEALRVVHAEDPQVLGELDQVAQTLHEAMDTVRASVHDLHDEAMDLPVQLRRVVDACPLDGVSLVYDARDVPSPVAYGIIAVVREALSNAVTHSDATRIEVSVLEHPALFQVIVQDNGTDRNCMRAIDSGGIGLHTMRERMESLGGRLLVDYRGGLRVFASIPKEES